MNATHSCPDLEQLERYADGRLESPETTRLTLHLEACDTCREQVDEISSHAALLGRLETALEPPLGPSRNGTAPGAADAAPRLPTIAGYVVEREIHRGGQGIVYAATQTSTRRAVAIKLLLHGGAASARDQRRFEREIDLAANLDHANIVTVYDSGVSEDGRTFLVMSRIDGLPLDRYLAGATPDRPTTLELLETIIDAVAYAHQRGVLHRDLKPNNILVDHAGRPHLLDFGLAKPLDAASELRSERTRSGEFHGTLAYAAPEQLGSDPSRVDVRADVYALGVVAFEMLTGSLPYPTDGGPFDLVKHVRETAPPRPSSLRPGIDDDLDTIVVKSLSKDPERRYQSALELGNDLRRYRAGDPIEAKRDAPGYVLAKLIKRHQAVTAVAALLLAALVTFAVYATAQAERQRGLATAAGIARTTAQEAEQRALVAADDAGASARHAQAVTEFLVETLGMADPDVTQTADLTAIDLLMRRAADVDAVFVDDPEAEAVIRTGLGQAFFGHGRLELAATNLARALELRRTVAPATDIEVYAILWPYTEVMRALDDPAYVRQRWDRAYFGKDLIRAADEEMFAARERFVRAQANEFYDPEEAAAAYDAMMERANQIFTDGDPMWIVLGDQILFRAIRMGQLGRPEMASVYFEKARSLLRSHLPDSHTRVVRATELCIWSLIDREDFDRAAALAEDSVHTLSDVLPPDHWYLATHRAWRARALLGQGSDGAAYALLAEAVPLIIEQRGYGSPHARRALADLVTAGERLDSAELAADRIELSRGLAASMQRVRWASARPALGPDHAAIIATFDRLVDALADTNADLPEAIDGVLDAASVLDASDVRSAVIADILTGCAARLWRRSDLPSERRYELSYPLINRAAEISRVNVHRSPRKKVVTFWWLAYDHEGWGDPEVGERVARDAIAILEDGLGPSYGLAANTKALLGACLLGQDRFGEAEPLLLEGYEGLLQEMGRRDGNTRNALAWLIELYEAWSRPADAERYRAIAAE